jgi:hypothetical protein
LTRMIIIIKYKNKKIKEENQRKRSKKKIEKGGEEKGERETCPCARSV